MPVVGNCGTTEFNEHKNNKKTRLHGTKKEALTDLRSAGSFKKKTNKNNRAAVKTPSDRIQ